MNNVSINLNGTIILYRYYKMIGEKSVEQLTDRELNQAPSDELHSVTILMKHISGSMISRWTNFRTEDGEKPWRNREQEFANDFSSRKELIEYWEKAWDVLFTAFDSIEISELNDIIYIRNEGHTLHEAIDRYLAHVSYHIGQIVYLSKWLRGDNWETLTILKGKTEEFNLQKFSLPKSTGFYKDRLK